MKKVKCQSCGFSVDKSDKFCVNCGTKLQAPKKNNRKLGLIALTLIVVAVSVTAIFNFSFIEELFSSNGNGAVQNESKRKDEVIVFRDNDRAGLMNLKLEIIERDIGSYITEFNEFGTAIASDYHLGVKSEWLINQAGEPMSEKYSAIGETPTMDFSWDVAQSESGVVSYRIKKDTDSSLMGLMNMDGEIITEARDMNILGFNGLKYSVFEEYDKFGIISETGEVIYGPMYSELFIFSNDYLLATNSTDQANYSIMNMQGEVIKENFTSEQIYKWTDSLFFYRAGNGKYGVINEKLDEVIPADLMSPGYNLYSREYLVSEQSGDYVVYNQKGKIILDDIDVDYLSNPDLSNRFPYVKGTEFGLLDEKGKVVFSHEAPYYSADNQFSTVAGMNVYKYVNSDGDYEYYDVDGNIISEYDQLRPIGSAQPGQVIVLYGSENNLIIGPNGNILAEDAGYIEELSGYLYYQDENGRIYLVDKFTGEVVESGELDISTTPDEEVGSIQM